MVCLCFKNNMLYVINLGVGKSYMISELLKRLSSKEKTVDVTASTGMAAQTIKGQTIHQFTGIGDGRFSSADYSMALSQDVTKLEKIRYATFYVKLYLMLHIIRSNLRL